MASKQIFISYAKEDYKIAKKIYNDLKCVGINAWLDTEELLPGQHWKSAIKKAIQDSSLFLALLSSNSVTKKGFVQKELKMALDIFEELPKSEIYILPVLLDDCKPEDEKLHEIHWCHLFPSYKEGLEKIMRVILPLYDINFEIFEKGVPKFMIKEIGAYNGQGDIESKIEKDTKVIFNGKSSLKLIGDSQTHRWNFLGYRIPHFIKRISAEFYVKVENVRKEEDQWNNCYVGFMYYNGLGEKKFNVIYFEGTHDWKKSTIHFDIEGSDAHNVVFGIFLSKSGTMWVNGIKFIENDF